MWYSWMIWFLLTLAKNLGLPFKNIKRWHVPWIIINTYQCHTTKIWAFHMYLLLLYWVLSNSVTFCWDSCHAPMIMIHVHPPNNANSHTESCTQYAFSIHKKNILHTIYHDMSLYVLKASCAREKGVGYAKRKKKSMPRGMREKKYNKKRERIMDKCPRASRAHFSLKKKELKDTHTFSKA